MDMRVTGVYRCVCSNHVLSLRFLIVRVRPEKVVHLSIKIIYFSEPTIFGSCNIPEGTRMQGLVAKGDDYCFVLFYIAYINKINGNIQ